MTPKTPPQITLTLNAEEVNLILTVLSGQVWNQVNGTIMAIQQQADAQLATLAMPTEDTKA